MAEFDFSQGFQGAAGGAMAGAALVPGPWGAAGGGILGLLTGFLGDPKQAYAEQLKQLAAGYANRQAPQAGAASQAGYSGFRQNQAGLVSQLEAMARGEGPSAARMQMLEAMDRAAGAQASAAAGAGGRGVNSGAAYRNAANNTAAIQSQGARDTATIRAAEQANAMGQLGQTLAQGRASDENINSFNANAQNQVALANLQAKLQQLGLNDRAQLEAMMMAMGGQSPGLGTQVLAGGAQAFPSILQWQMAQNQAGAQAPTPQYSPDLVQAMQGLANPGQASGPVTSPANYNGPSMWGQYYQSAGRDD